jgi:hypothetical protein
MNKILKRKVIIREYDYQKIKKQVQSYNKKNKDTLYDSVTFIPITKDSLEKDYIIYLLTKKETTKYPNVYPDELYKPSEYPISFLRHMKKNLYDQEYIKWKARYNEDGYFLIRYNDSTPETMLGWAVLEKHL